MTEEPPADIPRLLREALESLLAAFRPLLIEAGLTEQQWRVLRSLQDGPLSQVELSTRCAMRPASMSGVLARMERDGLVVRRRSGTDRRRVDVVPTPLAESFVARLTPLVQAEYTRIVEAVGYETLAALASAATALRDRVPQGHA